MQLPTEIIYEILLQSSARTLHNAHPNRAWTTLCYVIIERHQYTLKYIHGIGIKCALFMFIVDHKYGDRYRQLINDYSMVTFVDSESTLVVAIPFISGTIDHPGIFAGHDELVRALGDNATISWSYSFMARRCDFPLGLSCETQGASSIVDIEYTDEYIKIISCINYDTKLILDTMSPFIGRSPT